MKYLFKKPLIKGVIISRPNRFIMMVKIGGEIHKCHCPSTGKIGTINFNNVPCLLSVSDNPARKTKYTVEVIYPEKDTPVGINQTRANNYINLLFQDNLLDSMVDAREIQREVKLNCSRIDFLINNNLYLEVKTLLMHLPFGEVADFSKFDSFERTGRHYLEIASQIQSGQKAIVLLCFMYDAQPFTTPPGIKKEILQIIKDAKDKGLERWQINLAIDTEGMSLQKYFKID